MTRLRDSSSVQPATLIHGSRPRNALTADQDDEWLERVRAGDPLALDRLVRQEAPRVTRLLVRMLGPRPDLEDLVQNVFLETCRALPRFRGDAAVSTFIGGITVHVARRAMRPSAWFTRRAHVEVEPVAVSDPERATAHGEQLRALHRALEKVAPRKRIAFLLWALDGLDIAAIAELTGASPSATKSRIFHAQKELKRRAERDPYLRGLLRGDDDGAG
jgi:RNA polymerase sigma-70 factor, ECF subfamily